MSAKSETDDTEMAHLTVRVPTKLIEEIDETWEERGFASRSEFLRQIIREGVYPSATLSDEALEARRRGREERAAGKYVSLEDA